MSNRINPYGLGDAKYLVELSDNCLVAKTVLEPLRAMIASGETLGFKPRVVSAFRSFSAQSAIVETKWLGQRAIVDDNDGLVQRHDDEQWLKALLRFSALPGASRHHWGTDVDIVDQRVIDQGHSLQLVPSEYATSGVMGEFAAWLRETAGSFGFSHPYATDTGWVSPEPWHISNIDEANQVFKQWSYHEWKQLAAKHINAQIVSQLENPAISGYVTASMCKVEINL